MVQIEEITQHEHYQPYTSANNIALLKTRQKLILNQTNADKIDIQNQELMVGSDLNITGWGITGEGDRFPNDLRFATLIVSDKNECNTTLNGTIMPTMLCARSDEPYICSAYGDRGGPGVNFRHLYGIMISWFDCHKFNGYEAFTDIYYFYDWILNITNRI